MSYDEDDDNGSGYEQDEIMEDEENGIEPDEEMDDDDEDDDNDNDDNDGDGDDDDADGEGDGEGDNDADNDADSDDESRDGDGDGDGDADRRQTDKAQGRPGQRQRDGTHSGGNTPNAPPALAEVRADMISAAGYDIVPTVAAPQATSINAVCATRDTQWVFSGGADGYIRRFNWVESINGKLPLTVAQRHPFVDSITKAGSLSSYWDSEEFAGDSPVPVHSLAVHKEALWILAGLETGAISLQSVRHGEGSVITYLREHSSVVSELSLAPDERSLLSAGWDRRVLDWDLDTGNIIREFKSDASQITCLHRRPESAVQIRPEVVGPTERSGTFGSNNGAPVALQEEAGGAAPAQEDPPDLASPDDLGSLFGESRQDPDDIMMMPIDDDQDEFMLAVNEIRQQQAAEAEEAERAAEFGAGTKAEGANGATNGTAVASQNTNGVLTNGTLANGAGEQATTSGGGGGGGGADVDYTARYPLKDSSEEAEHSQHVFLESSMNGVIRIWDKRQASPVGRIPSPAGVPAWCMDANWSWDGNFIYAGRKNNTVHEYSMHHRLAEPVRTFRLPTGSGPVSALLPMPNRRHLICASHDTLRLYDLRHEPEAKQSVVPFVVIPGHRTGAVAQLHLDPTSSFLISVSGARGWDGLSTEVLLGYEIYVTK